MAFRSLQAEVTEKKEALKVATSEISTLQVVLVWRGSWFVFDINIAGLVRLPKIWALML